MAHYHGETVPGSIDPIRQPPGRSWGQRKDCAETSEGDRTVAIIAFLLSLQQYVESPFRAIDEFDVHMDPKNRETVTKLIYAAATSSDPSEYIAITPGEVTLPEGQDVHVVVVQNVEGASGVKELK